MHTMAQPATILSPSLSKPLLLAQLHLLSVLPLLSVLDLPPQYAQLTHISCSQRWQEERPEHVQHPYILVPSLTAGAAC
ncbi:hypothetical protein BD289DRAFT_444180 [Coniella lustricola]|uniref:Secreted protein n=1 Tax=Coniella lustricola TaxID=2025994 RepID=A0A2T2ZW41_9PEZI|nr:hypothetical protein BD289DRAFT_444180 [Coniella lustricola]